MLTKSDKSQHATCTRCSLEQYPMEELEHANKSILAQPNSNRLASLACKSADGDKTQQFENKCRIELTAMDFIYASYHCHFYFSIILLSAHCLSSDFKFIFENQLRSSPRELRYISLKRKMNENIIFS